MSPSRYIYLLFFFFLGIGIIHGQSNFPKEYLAEDWAPKLDSLRTALGKNVSFKNKKGMELATLLALSHYPELQDRKVKVIIKNMRGAPVEASFGVFNFIKPRRKKVYKILIQENSFMERLSLNKQVAALGHEMAHFIQYEQRKYFGTLFTLLQYVISDKYRLRFEKQADELAVLHNLGPQMLDFAFYSSDDQIREYMKSLDND
ncbi:hypothetical protein [Roseivirga misakiensis]|uniref:Peptidase M48 domain-containing protein n=1 Tax=Roseivirga misakiensis TaxID=1563681 RepID=A0A1E5T3J3_9BACT|nr:hypothetical protein [Roseivirga misakiensis]OEK05955.1 hypothetical protein BFP71_07535 [Roseivirga misakiensis]